MQLRTFATALVLAASPLPAAAMEGGQSPYFKGYRDFLTGVIPGPGVQVRQDLYLYHGNERSTLPQGQLSVGLKQLSHVLGVTVITPYQLFGASYGFSLRAGMTDFDASMALANRFGTVRRSGNLTALNDLVINPLILGWHAGNWHWNIIGAVFVPAGNYDRNRLANTGKNVWAFSPQAGVTWFDPKTGWEVSAAAIYVTSSTNTDTRYKSGDIAHVDFAAGRMLTPALKLGVVGYYAQQLAADSGPGAIVGARKLRIAGIGPGISYSFALVEMNVTLVAKYYREFDAQNTTQGDAGSLSLRVRF
jgi:hypothetical protein